jgi:hypothetical protein
VLNFFCFCSFCLQVSWFYVTFKCPAVAYANMCDKPLLEIHFIYLSNKNFLDMLNNLFYFSQNSIYVIILFFYCVNNMFFINYALKFKYHPGCMKVNFLSVQGPIRCRLNCAV